MTCASSYRSKIGSSSTASTLCPLMVLGPYIHIADTMCEPRCMIAELVCLGLTWHEYKVHSIASDVCTYLYTDKCFTIYLYACISVHVSQNVDLSNTQLKTYMWCHFSMNKRVIVYRA